MKPDGCTIAIVVVPRSFGTKVVVPEYAPAAIVTGALTAPTFVSLLAIGTVMVVPGFTYGCADGVMSAPVEAFSSPRYTVSVRGVAKAAVLNVAVPVLK